MNYLVFWCMYQQLWLFRLSKPNFISPFCQCGNLIWERDVCHVASKVVLNVRNENRNVTNITHKIKIKPFFIQHKFGFLQKASTWEIVLNIPWHWHFSLVSFINIFYNFIAFRHIYFGFPLIYSFIYKYDIEIPNPSQE